MPATSNYLIKSSAWSKSSKVPNGKPSKSPPATSTPNAASVCKEEYQYNSSAGTSSTENASSNGSIANHSAPSADHTLFRIFAFTAKGASALSMIVESHKKEDSCPASNKSAICAKGNNETNF